MTDSISVLTAILVIITAYYAWQTRGMVKEMETARLYQFLPSLKVNPTHLHLGDGFDVEIRNLGVGPAKNIRGTLKIEPDGDEVDIIYTILYPTESFSLHAPFKCADSYKIAKEYKQLTMEVCFEDIANITHENKDVFMIEDIDKTRNDDHRASTIVEVLNEIKRTLDSIEGKLGR
ncbi:hypothetical protein [uncultured Methanolobus sp.]|uniref:hypothetical protein n=1 Tax=uncultured Methanolobus sp. TaxID=218300 RepID=UPI002AAA8F48|nr:hypothetical protein [uncultured Methanolobus sp.]